MLDLIPSALRIALGCIWLIAAVSKLRNVPEFTRAIGEFVTLPPRAAQATAIVLPCVELITGISLTTGYFSKGAASTSSALLIAFTSAIVVNLLQGKHPRCNCFGANDSAPISWGSVARNVALLFVSLWVVFGTTKYLSFPALFHHERQLPEGWSGTDLAPFTAVIVSAILLWQLIMACSYLATRMVNADDSVSGTIQDNRLIKHFYTSLSK
jgi:uncharacterized membrane protein YphA (DoxX/SURF4 family)